MSDPEVEDTPAIKQLRDANKQLAKELEAFKAQAAEGEAAKRKLAFAEAGVDLSKPMAKLGLKAYDGDGSPESIQAFIKEFALVEEAPASKPDPALEAFQRMQQAGTGNPPPVQSRDAEYQAAMEAATTPEAVLEVAQRFGRAFNG